MTGKMTGREQGTVKWFNAAKGYGFIAGDDGQDVFVHYTAIRGSGYRNLEEGQRVEYGTERSFKGTAAIDVERLDDQQSSDAWSDSSDDSDALTGRR